MQAQIAQKLHLSHLGYDSMLHRARSTVYLPGMHQNIKSIADKCNTCQKYKPNN